MDKIHIMENRSNMLTKPLPKEKLEIYTQKLDLEEPITWGELLGLL